MCEVGVTRDVKKKTRDEEEVQEVERDETHEEGDFEEEEIPEDEG